MSQCIEKQLICASSYTRKASVKWLLLVILMLNLALLLPGCKAKLGKWNLDLGKKSQQEGILPDPDFKVAMIAPLPLPDSVRLTAKAHEKVVTGEFYSNEAELEYSDGYFIPNEYLFVITKNLGIAAELRKLNMDIHDSLIGINEGEYDVIVFPAVTKARVDSEAAITLEAKLVDGKTFLPLRTVSIEKKEHKRLKDPVHEPVHFVGKHERDFQNQRTLFSYTAYLCAQDLIDQIVKGAQS